ncbi:MAG: hypothetical protein HKN67_11925 [Saprospiraceae bacterium]|nr:hypothetical protein [Saprospiraceae bacterium]
MKKYLYSFFVLSFALLASSCNDEIIKTLDGEYITLSSTNTDFLYLRAGDFQAVPMGAEVGLIAAPQASDVSYTFEVVDSLSTAIANLHYSVDSNSGVLPAGDVSGVLPISISPDNIEQDEVLTLALLLTSADLELANDKVVTYTFSITCESELAGTVDYTHFDNFAGQTLNGSTEITLAGMTPGIYRFEDFSFGAWTAAYGIDPPTGTLEFSHICGIVSMYGTDNYGDTWQMDEVVEADGPNFTFKWSNTYGEFGTVTLTRQDGENWPKLSL